MASSLVYIPYFQRMKDLRHLRRNVKYGLHSRLPKNRFLENLTNWLQPRNTYTVHIDRWLPHEHHESQITIRAVFGNFL